MNSTSSKLRLCSECGCNLSDSAPNTPCPACLMQLGLRAWSDRDELPAGPGMARTLASHGDNPNSALDPMEAEEICEIQQQFPQFEILHKVGQGGMGTVYCARQKSLNRLVALKVIKPDANNKQDFADRFVREARALAQLNHPNIITVHDFGETRGMYFFVMEYIDGINLRQMLLGQKLTPHQALEIVPAVCDALQYAHDKGIVHRDIKPENILVDTEGKIKIADFGLAKLLDKDTAGHTLTQANQVMGTMHYMAPEQIEKPLTVDHRADIYSLGVVIYELLTGELPIGRFAPPSRKVSVDIRLDEIVLHTLEKEPSLRYQRVSDVKSDMQSVSEQAYLAAAVPVPPAGHGRSTPAAAARPVPPVKSRGPSPYLDPGPGPLPGNGFWGAVGSGQSFKNMLFLLLSFPLGIVYFVTMITGLATGLGTVIIWVGLLILVGTFLLSRVFTTLERQLIKSVLRANLAAPSPTDQRDRTVFQRAAGMFTSSRTWLEILYLIGKFPLGIVSFVLLITLMVLPFAFLVTPIMVLMPWSDLRIGAWRVDSIPEALLFTIGAIPLLAVSTHVLNGIAWLHVQWARLCLNQNA